MKESNNIKGVTGEDGSTKARIERAAINLFAERGVDAVTTREIAAASGVSEGALYRHFPGKEELALTVFMAIHQKLAAKIRDATAHEGGRSASIHDQARAVVRVYCQTADDDWPLFSYHLLTTHRYLPSPDLPQTSDQESPVAAVEELILSAMERGELPKGDAYLKAAMALGVVLQAAVHIFYGRVSGVLSDHEDQLTAAVLAVLNS